MAKIKQRFFISTPAGSTQIFTQKALFDFAKVLICESIKYKTSEQ
jgi:hypothetical protein